MNNSILSLQPRDYQLAAEADIRDAFRRRARAVLMVAPTGSGKTVTFSRVAAQATEKGNRVLILVHRQELLRQTSRTLDVFGVQHGLIAAGVSMRTDQSVQVASVQTLVRRLDAIEAPQLIIVDEAHHATGKTTWGKVLNHYSRARILGVTATPERLDGQGLGVDCGGFFDAMVMGPTVADLTARGYLSPAVVYAPKQRLDLSGVSTRMGDFVKNELAAALDKPTITGDAVSHYAKHAHQEPAIAFCASVAHAEHVAQAFTAAGYQAASIDGSMTSAQRASRINDLAAGALHILTSCDLISEGTDIPVVSAAILLRPTQSVSLALQQMGRVLRPFPGKQRAVILDHVGNVFRHGLPDDDRQWSLDAKQRKGKQKQEAVLSIRQCERCFSVHRPAPACPTCGYIYPVKSREVEEVDGELEVVTRSDTRSDNFVTRAVAKNQAKQEQGRARSFEELVEIGRKRGFSHPQAWATHVWQSRQKKGVTA